MYDIFAYIESIFLFSCKEIFQSHGSWIHTYTSIAKHRICSSWVPGWWEPAGVEKNSQVLGRLETQRGQARGYLELNDAEVPGENGWRGVAREVGKEGTHDILNEAWLV